MKTKLHKHQKDMLKYITKEMGSYGIKTIRIGSKVITIPKKEVKNGK